jgi:hypothetical protein
MEILQQLLRGFLLCSLDLLQMDYLSVNAVPGVAGHTTLRVTGECGGSEPQATWLAGPAQSKTTSFHLKHSITG